MPAHTVLKALVRNGSGGKTSGFFPGTLIRMPPVKSEIRSTSALRRRSHALLGLPYICGNRGDSVTAMYGLLLRQMREHLNPESSVQIINDSLLPWTPDYLRCQTAGNALLLHDVIGKFPSPLEKFLLRDDFIYQTVLKGPLGVDRLTSKQGIGGSLDAQ